MTVCRGEEVRRNLDFVGGETVGDEVEKEREPIGKKAQ